MSGGILQRLKVRLRDDLYYAKLPRELTGRVHALRARFSKAGSARLEHAIQSYRFSNSPSVRKAALRVFREHADNSIWMDEQVGWGRYGAQVRSDPTLTRTVILKPPGQDGEKGVILTTFEYNWLRLFTGIPDFRDFEQEYDVILSTSSSPSNYALLGLALQLFEDDVLVQVCNYSEIDDVEALHPRFECLPMLPCDWINPAFYEPHSFAERDIDILMVAGWAPVKRQWHLYQALSRMPRDLRVVMIGQAEGPFDIEHARRQAELFGAKQDIEFHQSMSIDEVTEYQCRAKISLILSRREGCCVAVTESFFANTPVGLVADAHIGPKAYINKQTGVLLDRKRDLSRQLTDFLERADTFAPRAWAEENIACDVSAIKLNAILKDRAAAAGRPWTRDILTPCWRAHPTMYHHPGADSLRPSYHDLSVRYPDVFPPDLMKTSGR